MSARGALATVLIVASATSACAGESPVIWYTNIDNDVAFHKDRWYTSGVRFYRSQALEAPGTRLDVGVIQELYTDNTNCRECQVADHPYAGRLLASLAYQAARPASLTTLGADIGVLGPAALGRETQKVIHQFVPSPRDDWSQQLDNRLDFQMVAVHSQRVLASDDGMASLVAHGGGVLGTAQTFVHAGGELRVGGAMTAVAPSMRFAATPPAPLKASGWSGFAGFSFRNVYRNRLLVNNADDPAPSPSRNRTVRRIAIGVGWVGEWMAAGFALVTESREFREQYVPQRFGTLTVQFDFK